MQNIYWDDTSRLCFSKTCSFIWMTNAQGTNAACPTLHIIAFYFYWQSVATRFLPESQSHQIWCPSWVYLTVRVTCSPSRRSESGDIRVSITVNAVYYWSITPSVSAVTIILPICTNEEEQISLSKNAFLIKSTHNKSWSCDETDQCKSGGKTSCCCVQTLRCSLRRCLINLTDVWAVAHVIRFACAVFSHCKLHLQPCCHFLLHRTSKKGALVFKAHWLLAAVNRF